MDITILLYDGMTALDAIGPYEVLVYGPRHRVRFVAPSAGPVTLDSGVLQLIASEAVAAVDRTDILLVPGGLGSRRLMGDADLLGELRRLHQTTRYTTSVCTGSLLLAAAGILQGVSATTHWSQLEFLGELGAKPTQKRIVEQGKIITAAGVSAGIDMALHLLARLHGEELARAVQLYIEYDPAPPFDSGSPAKAGPEIVERVRRLMQASEAGQSSARAGA